MRLRVNLQLPHHNVREGPAGPGCQHCGSVGKRFAFGPATARRVKAKLCSRLDRTRRRAGAGEGSSGLREVTDRLLECQSSRQWEEGFGVLQDAIASTVKVDVIAMGIAMSMAQKSPEAAAWASAVAVGKDMSCRAISANQVTLGTLLSAYGMVTNWLQAVQLVHLSYQWPVCPATLTVVSFNAMLAACRVQWPLTLHMLFASASQRLPPDVVSYNTVASNAGPWTWAVKLLTSAREASVRCNTIGNNAVIAACSTSFAWREAVAVADTMQFRGIQCSTVTCNSLGTANVRASHWQKASVVQDFMLDSKLTPDALSFNVILSALDRAEQPQSALNLLFNIKRHRLQLTPMSFGSAMSALSRGTRWRNALQLLSIMASSHLPAAAQVCNSALLACSRSSSWQWTFQLHEERPNADEVAAVAVVSAYDEAGRWQDALELLLRCSRERRLISSAALHVSACSACTRGRCWEQSLLLWEDMRFRGFAADEAAQGALLQSLSAANLGLWASSLRHVAGSQLVETGPLLRNFAMVPCEQVRQWTHSLAMSMALAQVGLQADVNTFGILLGSLQVIHQWVRSMLMVHQLRLRWCINEVHAGAAIATAQASQHWTLACDLLLNAGGMRVHFREPSTAFGAALEACSAYWWVSLTLAEEMSCQGLLPTLPLLAVKSDALE